ncbi:MAG TPA: AAA family ATPase [Gemmatimonadaceae bacterium]
MKPDKRPSRPPRRPLPVWLDRLAAPLLRAAAGRPWLFPALGAAMVAAAATTIVLVHRTSTDARATVPYSTLAEQLGQGAVKELAIENGGATLVATLERPVRIDGEESGVLAARTPFGSVALGDLERWAATGATVRVESDGAPKVVLPALVTLIVVGAVVFLVVHQHRGPIRRSSFRASPTDRHISLADVGGAREAQLDLRDVIAYLKDPTRFDAMGATCPKGVLLVGPPGTGKTLLARAVAGESGCPVLVASGAEFNEMYVGVGARRIRELAKQARAQAPCIVFIDEFDSVGGRRGRPNRSGEEENTLNQLLVEMDGMSAMAGVVWMAATNREDMLDPAVRRPGRFDRIVEVGMPTMSDRVEILKVHAAKRPLAPDVDLDRLAGLTIGYSGADIANLLNEAAILAVHEERDVITMAHIDQARDRILLGRIRAGVVVSDEERRLVALHEAGHAIVGLVACPDDRLHKVTIEPRGRSLGAAHFAPDSDRHLHSRRYLEGVIAKALGGRAAELVFLGPDAVTSGAGGDLVQATSVARRMVAEFGMSDEVGLVSADPAAQGGAPSAQLQSKIDTAVRELIARQMERAETIVREHREAIDAVAEALLERSALLADEVHEIARRHAVPIGRPTPGKLVAVA